jgi:hypothetical protein
MPLEKLYACIKNKNLEEGTVYIITGDKHLVEVQIYYEVIVHVKSRTLSHEQIIDSLLSGNVGEVTESPSNISLDDIQPATIAKTFHACAPFIFNVDDAMVKRFLSLIRLLGYVVKSGADGFAAFDVITTAIYGAYPKFSLESAIIKKRIEDFSNEFLIAYPFLNSEPLPPDGRLIPGWIFNRITIPDGLFKDIFIYFIFLGDIFEPIFRTIVKKESSFGAKVDHARMSKVIYSAAAKSNSVVIFKGASKAGELNLLCHSEKKTGILITQTDLNKLGIRDGDTVSLIFKSK